MGLRALLAERTAQRKLTDPKLPYETTAESLGISEETLLRLAEKTFLPLVRWRIVELPDVSEDVLSLLASVCGNEPVLQSRLVNHPRTPLHSLYTLGLAKNAPQAVRHGVSVHPNADAHLLEVLIFDSDTSPITATWVMENPKVTDETLRRVASSHSLSSLVKDEAEAVLSSRLDGQYPGLGALLARALIVPGTSSPRESFDRVLHRAQGLAPEQKSSLNELVELLDGQLSAETLLDTVAPASRTIPAPQTRAASPDGQQPTL